MAIANLFRKVAKQESPAAAKSLMVRNFSTSLACQFFDNILIIREGLSLDGSTGLTRV